MKIKFYAPDNSMGDTSPMGCEYFREWARLKIEHVFPCAHVDVTAEDATQSIECDSDDEWDAVNDFCCRLWDNCDWTNFTENTK